MKNYRLFVALLFALVFAACEQKQQPDNTPKQPSQTAGQTMEIKHARGFRISYYEGYKLVEVVKPWKNARTGFKYLLLPHGAEVPAHDENTTVVRVPVQRLVATSTTHLPAFDMLGAADKLKGFPNTDYISSEVIRKQVKSGSLQNLGPENSMNMELLVSLAPDMIMSYSMGGKNEMLENYRRTGIPVVLNADYMENTPLGRAEWIKFTAAFLNKEKEAQRLFDKIEQGYDSLRNLARKADGAPTAYLGIVYGDTWYMPGGQSWAARFLKDAQAHYLWQDHPANGTLELSFEAVYAEAHDADIWLNTGAFESLKAIANYDSRYTKFKAFQNGEVFNNNAKIGAEGGHTYLELGAARPDLVLADLIKILHPDLLPEHELYFYQKLN